MPHLYTLEQVHDGFGALAYSDVATLGATSDGLELRTLSTRADLNSSAPGMGPYVLLATTDFIAVGGASACSLRRFRHTTTIAIMLTSNTKPTAPATPAMSGIGTVMTSDAQCSKQAQSTSSR